MKKFKDSFKEVDRLTQKEQKPLCAMLGKLMEEVGETAECVLIHEGFITHKEMKEPLVGEIADTIQVALSILVRSTPELTTNERYELLLSHLDRKNQKWDKVQQGESKRVHITPKSGRSDEEKAIPKSAPSDIEIRVRRIVQEHMACGYGDTKKHVNFVDDLAADSLDLIEMCMGLEDEFEMEISDDDAEKILTVKHAIDYVYKRYQLVQTVDEMLGEVDVPTEEDLLQANPFDPTPIKEFYDPAADYTDRTGRSLTLEERMQERSLFSLNTTHGLKSRS